MDVDSEQYTRAYLDLRRDEALSGRRGSRLRRERRLSRRAAQAAESARVAAARGL
jgi:hypothetical protein